MSHPAVSSEERNWLSLRPDLKHITRGAFFVLAPYSWRLSRSMSWILSRKVGYRFCIKFSVLGPRSLVSLWRNHQFCSFLPNFSTLCQAGESPLCHISSFYGRYREATSCQVTTTRALCAVISSLLSYHDTIDLHCCVLSRPPWAWFKFPYFWLCRFKRWECLRSVRDVFVALASIRSC